MSFAKPLTACFAIVAATVSIAAGTAAQDVFEGARLYEQHCASCHGFDGTPVVPGTPDFARGEGLLASDNVLFLSIKQGKGLMPAFQRAISEREILDVLSYSRTLQR